MCVVHWKGRGSLQANHHHHGPSKVVWRSWQVPYVTNECVLLQLTSLFAGEMLAEEMSLAANGKKASLQLMTAAKVCDYNHCMDCGYWLYYLQGDHIQHAMTVLDQGNGRDKILVYRAQGEDATPEEVVLSIQGYLVKAKMPPITQESEYVTCIWSLCHSWYCS